MSAYDGVVVGKLKLKGKPLDVKSTITGGITKHNKKKKKKMDDYNSYQHHHEDEADKYEDKGNDISNDDHLTPAERRFLQQTEKFELQRLAKMARSSHRDRIQHFNQYLANLSEHYDIPKVGPG